MGKDFDFVHKNDVLVNMCGYFPISRNVLKAKDCLAKESQTASYTEWGCYGECDGNNRDCHHYFNPSEIANKHPSRRLFLEKMSFG